MVRGFGIGVAMAATCVVVGCGDKQTDKPSAASCGDVASASGSLKDITGQDGAGDVFVGKPMPDNGVGPEAVAAQDATPTDVAVDATADAQQGDAGTKPSVWTPHWKDEHGCEYYEHFDAASGACLPDNAQLQLDELACWSHGPANDLGVGMPCKPGVTECPSSQKANCCRVSDQRLGAICTLYCANAGKPDPVCGPGTWCSPNNLCMPAMCQAGFTDSQRPYVRDVTAVGLACDPTPSNAFLNGVGTPCTGTGNECASLKAKKCLGFATKPLASGVSSFCSHECKADTDCGAGASCVFFSGKPYFCVPTSCKAQFAGFTFVHEVKDSSLPLCNQPPKP